MCLLFNSIIQKSKSNTLLSKIYKLSKTNTFFSRFEGTRGEKNQIFRTIEPNTQELTQDISVSKLQEMFDEITKKLLAKLVLIKPTEFLLCGNDLKWNDLSKDDQKTLQALIIDTMDVIEFKDFNSVLTSCISSGYGTILDQIANDIPSGDLITQKGLKLAKLIPKLDKIFQGLLTPNVNQSKLQSFEARIFETFCLSQPH